MTLIEKVAGNGAVALKMCFEPVTCTASAQRLNAEALEGKKSHNPAAPLQLRPTGARVNGHLFPRLVRILSTSPNRSFL